MDAAINPDRAQELCTADEWTLVQFSYPPDVNGFNAEALRDLIRRARRLRDKFRDLGQRQHLEAVGKREPSGKRPAIGNAGTVEKARLFSETIQRFQARLDDLLDGRVRGADDGLNGDNQAINAHIGSRDRRDQAKRDGR